MDFFGLVADRLLSSLEDPDSGGCAVLAGAGAQTFDDLTFGPSPLHREVLVAWTEFSNGLGATVFCHDHHNYEVLMVDGHGVPLSELHGGKRWRVGSRAEVTRALQEIAAIGH